MSTLEPDPQDAPPPPTPCACCRKPAIGRIWLNTDVCADCHGDWQNRASNEGALDAKYGGPATLTQQTASYERFTAAWLVRRKAELRAHLAVVPQPEAP